MPSVVRQPPPDTATHHHVHDFHQIVIGLRGQAELEIEGLEGEIPGLSGCIVPTNHVLYYAGMGNNQQLILDLPAPALTGFHHELSHLFDAPRFFSLNDPLKRYLDFLLHELASSPHSTNGNQGDRLAATLLGWPMALNPANVSGWTCTVSTITATSSAPSSVYSPSAARGSRAPAQGRRTALPAALRRRKDHHHQHRSTRQQRNIVVTWHRTG